MPLATFTSIQLIPFNIEAFKTLQAQRLVIQSINVSCVYLSMLSLQNAIYVQILKLLLLLSSSDLDIDVLITVIPVNYILYSKSLADLFFNFNRPLAKFAVFALKISLIQTLRTFLSI